MTLFLNKVISSIIQIILFAAIPFVWWFISGRKQEKFMQWICGLFVEMDTIRTNRGDHSKRVK